MPDGGVPRGEVPPRRPAPRKGRSGKGRPGKAKRPAGASRPVRMYAGAAGVLGIVAVLVLVAVFVLRGEAGTPGGAEAGTGAAGAPAGTGPSPASYSSSASSEAYAGIAQRRTDPAPLTAKEAFPPAASALQAGKARPALRGKQLDADCTAAVWGGTVAAELRRGRCTQAARMIYADPRSGHALAVAVFNLASAADADRFVATLDRARGGGFVRPLPVPGSEHVFGQGYGMARGLGMGHFAVVTWAERLDGKGDARDETLLSLLIEGGKVPAVLGRAARTAQ